MKHFNELDLPDILHKALSNMEFSKPTKIQGKTLPYSLKGRDILGTAKTGTGKTAAYGIPLVAELIKKKESRALVMLPTRELAAQVIQTLRKLLGGNTIKTALLIGGERMFKQFKQLDAKPRLIVGTPGRIKDHLARKKLHLHQTNFLVLDEVDRMLDMGFSHQIEAIVRCLAKKRQTLMFSATLPKNIEKLSNKYLHDPMRIAIDTNYGPPKAVKQKHIRLSEGEKYPKLVDELYERAGSIIIFLNKKHAVDRMALKLRKLGYKVGALHGDLRQNKRTRVITAFRKKEYSILVATDVAARGLDIPHIEHVINYDLPQDSENYIHRIGRTARAGATGEALNFISSNDRKKWRAIEKLWGTGTKK